MAYKDKKVKTKKQNEFISKAYDRINLTMPKGKKEQLKAAADSAGESTNTYINNAIEARLAAGGYGFPDQNADTLRISYVLSHLEQKKISALLTEGQTVEEFCKTAALEKIQQAGNGAATVKDDTAGVAPVEDLYDLIGYNKEEMI